MADFRTVVAVVLGADVVVGVDEEDGCGVGCGLGCGLGDGWAGQTIWLTRLMSVQEAAKGRATIKVPVPMNSKAMTEKAVLLNLLGPLSAILVFD